MIKIENFGILKDLIDNKNCEIPNILITSESCPVCHTILDYLDKEKNNPLRDSAFDKITNSLGWFCFTSGDAKDWLAHDFFKTLTSVPVLIQFNGADIVTTKLSSLGEFVGLLQETN